MSRKLKKYNVGLESQTYAISMVEKPAIEEDFVALASQEEEKVFLSSDEKHIVYGAVLVPGKDIYRNNEKRGEYFINFSSQAVEKMSQDFMKEYRQFEVKTDHKNVAGEVCVVESWLKSDLYKDKSVALGLNPQLPVGTWFCGMKVNNVDTWNRIRKGELKGFSVESMLSLEEFEQNEIKMNIEETNEEMFFSKIKDVFKEVLASCNLSKREPTEEELAANSGLTVDEYREEVKAITEELEEQNPAPADAANATHDVTHPEPVSEPSEPVSEPQPTPEPAPAPEPVTEPKNEPVVEEPKPNPLEEFIKNLQDEIKALKENNQQLVDKVTELGKQPTVKPINPNAQPSNQNVSFSDFQERLRAINGM